MKATGLMIGDWVRITEPDNFAGATVKISSLSNQEGAYFAVTVDDPKFGYYTREVFCEDIESIPLTEEILKKNGFKERDRCWAYRDNSCSIKLNIAPKIEIDGEILGEPPILMQAEGATFNLGIIIEYVHELQHALKLCGIEKEITL